MNDVLALHAEHRLVPLLVLEDAASAAGVAQALSDGGLPSAEVALRTPDSLEALREMARQPDFMVGAGTVVRPEQVAAVVDAGARYVVSPGFSSAVVAECAALGVPVIPGVATATEIQAAIEAGLDVVKFFPAETSGGVAALKALAAPFRDVRFLPTGGIDLTNLTDYLHIPSVLAVGGSWIAPGNLIAAGDFAAITKLTQEAVAAADAARPATTTGRST